MRGRSKSRGFSNPFKTRSYRRSMEALDDEFYAAQARKQAEAEAQGGAAKPREHTESQGDKKNG